MKMSNDECLMTKEVQIPQSNAWSFPGVRVQLFVSRSCAAVSFVFFEG
jgi:hypothetical protein